MLARRKSSPNNPYITPPRQKQVASRALTNSGSNSSESASESATSETRKRKKSPARRKEFLDEGASDTSMNPGNQTSEDIPTTPSRLTTPQRPTSMKMEAKESKR